MAYLPCFQDMADKMDGRVSRLERLLPELLRMVVQMLPNEDHLCLRMTSRTMYSQIPSLPAMARWEYRGMQRHFEARLSRRKLLSLVCTDCSKLKAPGEFSDYQRYRSKTYSHDNRYCLSCALDTSWFGKNDFNHNGVLSFACFGCKKGLPLVCRWYFFFC